MQVLQIDPAAVGSKTVNPQSIAELIVPWPMMGCDIRDAPLNHISARDTFLAILEMSLVLDAEGHWHGQRGFAIALPMAVDQDETVAGESRRHGRFSNSWWLNAHDRTIVTNI